MEQESGAEHDPALAAAIESGLVPEGTLERRATPRVELGSLIGLVLASASGERLPPQVLLTVDISRGGFGATTEEEIAPGTQAAVQIVREDGRVALVGATAANCRVTELGDFRVGFQFTPLPAGWQIEDFTDSAGRMRLFDVKLRRNITERARSAGEGGA